MIDSEFLILSITPSLRYNRDYIVEGEPYAGYDRHNAEVAAFHLDRCVKYWHFTVWHEFSHQFWFPNVQN